MYIFISILFLLDPVLDEKGRVFEALPYIPPADPHKVVGENLIEEDEEKPPGLSTQIALFNFPYEYNM